MQLELDIELTVVEMPLWISRERLLVGCGELHLVLVSMRSTRRASVVVASSRKMPNVSTWLMTSAIDALPDGTSEAS